jgi:hypothetical protein
LTYSEHGPDSVVPLVDLDASRSSVLLPVAADPLLLRVLLSGSIVVPSGLKQVGRRHTRNRAGVSERAPMINTDQLDQIQNATVYDSAGEKVGKAGSVYLDDTMGVPSWVTVKTGLFGSSESFAPLDGANLNGDRVDVAYTNQQIQDAPNLPADGRLEPDQERDLDRHFADPSASSPGRDELDESDEDDETNEGLGRDALDDRPEDRPDDLPDNGDKGQEPPRMRRYVVTERHTITVPGEDADVPVEPVPVGDAARSSDRHAEGSRR